MRAPRAATPATQNPRANWCLTLNNWTPEQYEKLKEYLTHKAKWWILGKEIAASGTPHLQGAFSLNLKSRLNTIKTAIGIPSLHLEAMKGTISQNRVYCSKEGNFEEDGQAPPSGTERMGEMKFQEQLIRAKEAIDDGASWPQVMHEHFPVYMKCGRTLKEYWNSQQQRREKKPPRVEIIWGTPGTGKTRYCHDLARIFYDDDIWIHGGGNWFDGYEGQRVAVFDDFYGCMDFGLLLKVLDRYKCLVPVKGSFVPWHPERIFITSNVNPANWYGDKITFAQFTAMMRRVHKVEEVSENIYE